MTLHYVTVMVSVVYLLEICMVTLFLRYLHFVMKFFCSTWHIFLKRTQVLLRIE